VAAGPFADQRDDSLRGLCFYATSVDEARTHAGQDPSVQSGPARGGGDDVVDEEGLG
jgi:hypothetical protein